MEATQQTVGEVVREKLTNMCNLLLPKFKPFVDQVYVVIYKPENVEKQVAANWAKLEEGVKTTLTRGVIVTDEQGNMTYDPPGSTTDEQLVREVRNNVFMLNRAEILPFDTEKEKMQSMGHMLQLITVIIQAEIKKFVEQAKAEGLCLDGFSAEDQKAVAFASLQLFASLGKDPEFLALLVRYYNCFVSLIVNQPEKN